ncbi:MAG: glycosyltransferase family protein, partial [Planctomycetota bacterium]
MPTHRDRRVFVSWWKYTSRPVSFALAMGAENYFFAQGASLWLFKYIPRALCCFWILLKRRPRLVFVSNPPTLAPFLVWLYCLLFDARYAIDCHTSAFDRKRWLRLMPLHGWLARRAIWEATTNEDLDRRINGMGAQGVVVPDIPFELPDGNYPVEKNQFTVAFICSFDVDEPVLEALKAARQLPDVRFYVTGNPKKAAPEVHQAKPDNVTFTGYLTNEDYGGLLRTANVLMALTTFDHTMQRG